MCVHDLLGSWPGSESRGKREHYLEASISTKLAGNPARHLTQCATWPALLRAGNRISEPPSDPAGDDDDEGGAIITVNLEDKTQRKDIYGLAPLFDSERRERRDARTQLIYAETQVADGGDGDKTERKSAVCSTSTLTGLDRRQGQKPVQSWLG